MDPEQILQTWNSNTGAVSLSYQLTYLHSLGPEVFTFNMTRIGGFCEYSLQPG